MVGKLASCHLGFGGTKYRYGKAGGDIRARGIEVLKCREIERISGCQCGSPAGGAWPVPDRLDFGRPASVEAAPGGAFQLQDLLRGERVGESHVDDRDKIVKKI
jgi:hypothetical protein